MGSKLCQAWRRLRTAQLRTSPLRECAGAALSLKKKLPERQQFIGRSVCKNAGVE